MHPRLRPFSFMHNTRLDTIYTRSLFLIFHFLGHLPSPPCRAFCSRTKPGCAKEEETSNKRRPALPFLVLILSLFVPLSSFEKDDRQRGKGRKRARRPRCRRCKWMAQPGFVLETDTQPPSLLSFYSSIFIPLLYLFFLLRFVSCLFN